MTPSARVDRLVRTIDLWAMSAFVPLLDEFPSVRRDSASAWDLYLSAAALHLSLVALAAREPEFHDTAAREIVRATDDILGRPVLDAVAEYGRFFEASFPHRPPSGDELSVSVGSWVLAKVRSQGVHEVEAPLARAVGYMTGYAASSSWGFAAEPSGPSRVTGSGDPEP